MYKIVEERFQGLYQKYCEAEDPMTEYDYYLTAVKEDGVSLFDVPYVYQTNELIMIALETSEKPIHLMTKLEIEMCIRNRREKLSNIDPIYRQPITDEELKSYLCDLSEIIRECR